MVMIHTIAITRATTLEEAAERVYAAECTLHAARQAQDDHWVAAAYERLHQTLEQHNELKRPYDTRPAA
jgi:predicted negative regulator of RcsB-dependent stress response